MALDKSQLKTRIVDEFVARGATAEGQYSWVNELAEALAHAIIDEIHQNAEVPVDSGSSAGTYPVE